jgi:hypothetical protein
MTSAAFSCLPDRSMLRYQGAFGSPGHCTELWSTLDYSMGFIRHPDGTTEAIVGYTAALFRFSELMSEASNG